MALSSARVTEMSKVGLRLFPLSNPTIVTIAKGEREVLTNEHRSIGQYQLDPGSKTPQGAVLRSSSVALGDGDNTPSNPGLPDP